MTKTNDIIYVKISYTNSQGETRDLELPVSEFIVIDINKQMINIEPLKDGLFRFIVSGGLYNKLTDKNNSTEEV